MVLFREWGEQAPVLILDVANPVKPLHLCTLSPADGARFVSATKVAFSMGDRLGLADLSNGAVVQMAQLPAVGWGGVFSRDGSRFAYRVADDKGVQTLHLWSRGKDQTLYAQEPLGGHGGPGWANGPSSQLQFSPDGQELLDYNLFRPRMTGPANLLVFKVDGSVLFQYTGFALGVWRPSGSLLYFSFWPGQPPATQVDAIDAAGQRRTVASGVGGLNWPSMTPDGLGIVYTAVDAAGHPHLWRLDLATGAATQVGKVITAVTEFVGPNVVWTNEGTPCECGPGGNSMPTGVVIAHDLIAGSDATVDFGSFRGPGGTPASSAPPSAESVMDVWF
jgi:hypothetical protein